MATDRKRLEDLAEAQRMRDAAEAELARRILKRRAEGEDWRFIGRAMGMSPERAKRLAAEAGARLQFERDRLPPSSPAVSG